MKIQLKRSNVLDNGVAKAPLSTQLDYGEIAVNYAAGDPTLFIKNSNDQVVSLTSLDWSNDSGGNLYVTNTLGDVFVGGESAGTAGVVLDAAGAVRTNVVDAGTPTSAVGATGVSLVNTGDVIIYANSDLAADKNFKLFNSSKTATVQFGCDGSADFSGIMTADTYNLEALDALPETV